LIHAIGAILSRSPLDIVTFWRDQKERQTDPAYETLWTGTIPSTPFPFPIATDAKRPTRLPHVRVRSDD
jgi:hypothetical protein